MTLVRYNPNRRLRAMARNFGNPLFHPFFMERNEERNFLPRVDVNELSDRVLMSIELPGIKQDSLSISVDSDRVLSIKGEKKSHRKDENEKTLRSEIFYGSFERKFTLTDEIDADAIDAKFENGVLELTLPKIEPEKPKVIEVTIN